MVTAVTVATAFVVIANVPVVAPAATVTDAGTVDHVVLLTGESQQRRRPGGCAERNGAGASGAADNGPG